VLGLRIIDAVLAQVNIGHDYVIMIILSATGDHNIVLRPADNDLSILNVLSTAC